MAIIDTAILFATDKRPLDRTDKGENDMVPQGKSYVTYIRVSTQKQGASGLGLEAQQAAVKAFLDANHGKVIAEYREVESGKVNDRVMLQAALKRCRQTRATLLVAKIDRLSRNAAFLLSLRDSGVKFVAADIPEMNEMVVGIMALIAQNERETISARTKAALAAAKARGTVLGNPDLQAGSAESCAIARKAKTERANKFAEDLREVIDDARTQGKTTLEQLADHLNELCIQTPSGSTWVAAAVWRLLKRLG